ncbi:hypothetical protein GBA65_21495 (plasmid) [Rubrobacter marinus]|uniref:DUF4352 domain-containing protein n=1 Tax=Rubrobacter marinus TaxID=2653852 RepID=A0A6G8Q3H6_9ACTN|nr:DUF4352 domain-containing protein [Rubrobacter marinus]QIN81022.1 hypothetical protein GBA65_21495 [Rubrobacter marinus]
MPLTQLPTETPKDREAAADVPEPGGARRRPRSIGGALLVLATVAALAFGVWGFSSSLAAGPAPASVGEDVEVPGGLMRVDGVTPEHMAPMQMDKFAKKGMNMSGMVSDMTPKGYRRFSVDFTLVGQGSAGLDYSVDRFRATGEGTKETKPLRGELEPGTVPQGSAVSGTMIFQVPEEAKGLKLSFGGGTPVALDLEPGSSEAGDHGGH